MSLVNEVNRKNMGVTLDFCHMLMKHENPACGASLLASKGKLFGVHLNDGYGVKDDGLMVGTSNLQKTIEFLYYLKLYQYNQAIFFDSFPIREHPSVESKFNIKILRKLNSLIDKIGIERITEIVNDNDSIKANSLIFNFLS